MAQRGIILGKGRVKFRNAQPDKAREIGLPFIAEAYFPEQFHFDSHMDRLGIDEHAVAIENQC